MISNISHAVSLNYLQKQIEDCSDTDYRNEIVNTTLENICIESSKEISNFDFDFNALNVSINKNVKATPLVNKTNPIKIKEQNFHSSNEKISISTGVFNSKSTNKYCSDSKESESSSKNLLFEFEKISSKKAIQKPQKYKNPLIVKNADLSETHPSNQNISEKKIHNSMAKNKTVNMVANIVKMFNTKCKSSIELTSKSANLSNIADHCETQNFTDFKNVKKLQVTSPSFVKNKPRDYHIKKEEKKLSHSKTNKNLVYKTNKFRLLRNIESNCSIKSQFVPIALQSKMEVKNIKAEVKTNNVTKIPRLKNLSSLNSIITQTQLSNTKSMANFLKSFKDQNKSSSSINSRNTISKLSNCCSNKLLSKKFFESSEYSNMNY